VYEFDSYRSVTVIALATRSPSASPHPGHRLIRAYGHRRRLQKSGEALVEHVKQ